MINIKHFDARLLKTDKKSYKNTDIYNIAYIAVKIFTALIVCIYLLIIQTDILKKKG